MNLTKPLFSLGILFLLMACAPERKNTSFDLSKESEKSSVPCGQNYSPLPLLRDGLVSWPSPDLIPVGTYSYSGGEFYLKDGDFQAHFSEEYIDAGVISRKICASELGTRIVEIGFPSIRQFRRTSADQRSHWPDSVVVLGEGQKIRLSRSGNSTEISGSILPILQKWSLWRIYSLEGGQIEIRLQTEDRGAEFFLTKRAVLRFSPNN